MFRELDTTRLYVLTTPASSTASKQNVAIPNCSYSKEVISITFRNIILYLADFKQGSAAKKTNIL